VLENFALVALIMLKIGANIWQYSAGKSLQSDAR